MRHPSRNVEKAWNSESGLDSQGSRESLDIHAASKVPE